MTETLTPPTVAAGADSPLALLFDIALEIGVQGEDEQREDAKTAALDHIWSHYPDTLGKAVDDDDWTGRPDWSRAPWPIWTAAGGCTTPSTATRSATSLPSLRPAPAKTAASTPSWTASGTYDLGIY